MAALTAAAGHDPGQWVAHPRKLIRHAIVAALIDATAAGTRVRATRIESLRPTQLPAISVETLNEEIDQEASAETAPAEFVRDLDVDVVGIVKDSDLVPFDDAMDDLAEQIETAIFADPYLGGLVSKIVLKGTTTEPLEDEQRSEGLFGLVRVSLTVTYRTSPAVSDDLDDFLTVKATHKIVGAVDDNAANDEFVVQEIAP